MSWSRSVSGSPSAVRQQLETVAKQVEATDRSVRAHDAIVAAHRSQVESAVGAVIGFADKLPDGATISGSIGGDAFVSGEVIRGSVSVSLSVSGVFGSTKE